MAEPWQRIVNVATVAEVEPWQRRIDTLPAQPFQQFQVREIVAAGEPWQRSFLMAAGEENLRRETSP